MTRACTHHCQWLWLCAIVYPFDACLLCRAFPQPQKLPDWKAVRSKTSTRWEVGASEASTPGAGTPKGSTPAGGTPAASRPGTPTAARLAAARAALPATAPAPPMQQVAQAERSRPATASRAGGAGGISSGGARPSTGPPGWSSSSAEPATYLLTPPAGLAAASPGARTAGGAQATGQQQRRRQRGGGGGMLREDAPWKQQQPKRGGNAGGGSARTTPFAPRPNSGESRQPWGTGHGSGGTQAWRRQRVRGTPIYDASTLLPLSVDGLLGSGAGDLLGSGGSGVPGLLAAGSLHAGHPAPRPGSHRLAHSGGSAAGTLLPPAGTTLSRLPDEAAAAAAAAGVVGPLDALLCAVDRMLHQVGRALD